MKDLTKIKAGDTLILRNGGREVCTIVNDQGFQSLGHHWHADGRWTVLVENSMDIIDYEPAPEKKQHSGRIFWFTNYHGHLDYRYVIEGTQTPPTAVPGSTLIAITPVTFKEGDGLDR